MVKRIGLVLISGALLLSLGSCEQKKSEGESADTKKMRTAAADMQATQGNEARGTVSFTEVEGGIRVVAEFEGVSEGVHGFHIHEYGDCSSGDGTSAGGHWNPGGVAHAGRDAEMRHVGDLGNVTADANGMAKADFVDKVLTFDGPNSILGKGVILHADADDLTSQPTGAAGGRISCGVIARKESSTSSN